MNQIKIIEKVGSSLSLIKQVLYMDNKPTADLQLIRFKNDLIFNNQSAALVTMVGVIALLIFSFRNVVPSNTLYVWSAVCSGSYLLRYFIVLRYQAADEKSKGLPIWRRRFMQSVVLSGAIWGSASLFIYPAESIAHQTILLLVISLLAVATTVTHSAYRGLSQIFVVCSMLPFIVRLLFSAEQHHITMAIFMLLLFVMLLGTAKNLRNAILKVYSLTVEKSDLAEALRKRNDDLIILNKNLGKARDDAEEASRAKSLFLANMSHEIRTPMHGLLGMVQVLENTSIDEQQRHYLLTLERSGKTLLSLLDDVLDLSKIESGEFALQPVLFEPKSWLNDIEMIVEPLFDGSDVEFRCEVATDLPEVLMADQTRLTQIIINLVGNAAKFTRKGNVTLYVGGADVGNNQYKLEIEVNDTGMGIPNEKLGEIFESFHQIKAERIYNKGVGLGLAISHKLAEMMGSRLWVKSTENEGSRFGLEITLPVADGKLERTTIITEVDELAPLSLLLVDDDPVSRLAVSTLLSQHRHDVSTASDGREGIELLRGKAFDVVLMDVHMPVLDGVGAVREIRADGDKQISTTPVIGMTASIMRNEKSEYYEAGMNAVIEKPVIFSKLEKVLKDIVDNSDK